MARPEPDMPTVGELRGKPTDIHYEPGQVYAVDKEARRSARRANILAGAAMLIAAIGTTTLGWFSWWVTP